MSREKQIEEMIKAIEKCSCVYTPCEQECAQCSNEELYDEIINHIARTVYEAGYRKQEWISVEERLPKNYRPVLVACEGLTIGGYAPIAIGSYGGGLWSLADADGTAYLTKYMRCTVTHWMHLPEPPKGE